MHDFKFMNVACCDDKLAHEMLYSFFWEHEITFLDIVKQVFAFHVFKYYKVVVTVLENV